MKSRITFTGTDLFLRARDREGNVQFWHVGDKIMHTSMPPRGGGEPWDILAIKGITDDGSLWVGENGFLRPRNCEMAHNAARK
jgi:hypothetical protein